MSFESCMIGLKLNGKLPAGELRADAAPYEAQGLNPEAALLRAVKDKLDMALMEEKSIVAAVRSAWEAKGGKPKAVKEAKADKPADIAGPDTMASKVAAPDFKQRVLQAAYGQHGSMKGIEILDSDGMLAAKMKKTGAPVFVTDGKFGRDQFKQAVSEARAAGLDTKRIYVYADSIVYTGAGIVPVRLDSLVGFGAESREAAPVEPAAAPIGTDNPAFARWFKGSKVVDAEGKPLVVYHGTDADISTFNGNLVWLTSDPGLANQFVAGGRNNFMKRSKKGAVYPLYASITNPIDLRGRDPIDEMSLGELLSIANIPAPDALFEEIARRKVADGITNRLSANEDPVVFYTDHYKSTSRIYLLLDDKMVRQVLYENGVDGVLQTESYRSSSKSKLVTADTFAAFRPDQIKSAVGNSGAYDPTDPNIMASLTGDLGMDSELRDHMEAIADERGMVEADELMRWVRVQGAPGAVPLANWLDAMGDALVSESSVVKFMENSGNAMFANMPTFYSALARAIPAMSKIADKNGMVKPEQARLWLAARQKEGKFKADELQWSGVDDWLKTRADKVSVDDIALFLEENGVQVEEVTKGNGPRPADALSADEMIRLNALRDAFRERDLSSGELAEMRALKERDAREDAEQMPPTKYSQYVLPGGESYRELLLTLPTNTSGFVAPANLSELPDGYDVSFDRMEPEGRQYSVIPPGQMHGQPYGGIRAGSAEEARAGALAVLNSERDNDARDKHRAAQSAKDYSSNHWDEKNIVAHIRFNSRLDAEGRKVLFVEELQSDWGQEGLKKGFASDADRRAYDAANKQAADYAAMLRDKYGSAQAAGAQSTQEEQAEYKRLTAASAALRVSTDAKPVAPFVTDTKSWLSLGIKRMIRYAVENGYDKVAFVNGEQSAARYDLSKTLDSVDVRKTGHGKVTVYASKDNQNVITKMTSHENLPDVIGKELAERVIADMEAGRPTTYSGLDLKVGGEGMKTFYDKIVPQTINDVLKKLGGGKAGAVNIGTPTPGFASGNEYVGPDHSLEQIKVALVVADKGGPNIMDSPLTGNRLQFAFNRSRNSTGLRKMIGLMEAGQSFREAVMHDDLASPDFAEMMGGEYRELSAAERKTDALAQIGFDITPELRASALDGLPLFSKGFDSSRRRLLVAAAAAAISPNAAADVKVGKAAPIDPNVLSQRVDKGVEKILRDGQASGTTSLNGGRALKQAMRAIALTGPKELRALASTIGKLLPDTGTIMLTVDDSRRMNVHGVVELAPVVHLSLFTAEGRTGLSYETVLHEALHIAVAARYRSLSAGIVRGNDKILGMSAPEAAESLKQFEAVWEEFRTATANEKFGNRQLELAVTEARGNPDEFFVRTMTDPVLQAYMAGKEYKGKTLWARFKDWVQSSLFGFKQEGTAPSWLDAALAASGDVAQAMGADKADFTRMAAISRVQAQRNNSRATPKGDQGARDLVITHNLTADNLIHAVKMGGIAVPSLAVTKKDSPLSGFGEITLIGSRSMADPKGYAGTKVFGADIYSPRYPSVSHKLDRAAMKKLNDALATAREALGGRELYPDDVGSVRDLSDSSQVRYLVLLDMGITIEPTRREDGTVDGWATDNKIRLALSEKQGYGAAEKKAAHLLEQADAEERIFNGYNNAGTRKYVPHTLENVVKILKKEMRGGENFSYGLGSVRAHYTPQFKTVKAIQSARDRLVSKDQMEKVKAEIQTEFDSLQHQLASYHPASGSFGFGDTVAMAMSDAAKMGVTRALGANGFDAIPTELQQELGKFLDNLTHLPTEYFEAKIVRDVDLAEFSGAVIPASASKEVRDLLASRGVPFTEYENEADRAAAIDRFAQELDASDGDVLFSTARVQEDSPEFKKWFGSSKVVNERGEPLVVYHGSTRGGIKRNGGRTSYFTSSREVARTYSEDDYEGSDGNSPVVQQAFLKIIKPLVVNAEGEPWMRIPFEGRRYTTDDLAVLARQRGHDGLIVRNVEDNVGNEDLPPADIFVTLGGKDQIKSADQNNGEFDGSNPDIMFSKMPPGPPPSQMGLFPRAPAPTWTAPEATKVDAIVQILQDKHIDMKRVVAEIRKTTGDIGDKFDPYLQEELFHGRSATGFKNFLHDELRPLLTDMQARGVKMEDFEQFLVMRHAEETNEHIASINPEMPDGGSGVMTQDAKDYLANLPPAKATAFRALAARVDAMVKSTQQVLLDYGLEKQSTIDAWNGAYKNYVPLNREDMDTMLQGMGTGQGFSIRGSSSKRRTGSDKAVVNVLANLAMAREKAIVRGEKNRLDLALYGLALKAPNPEFWKPVNPQKNPAVLQAELLKIGLPGVLVANYMDEPKQKTVVPRSGGTPAGQQTVPGAAPAGHEEVVSRVNTMLRSAPNVVAVRVNGEDRFIFFNDKDERALRMAMSLKNLGGGELNWFLGAIAVGTRWFASVNTQYNPIFGVVNLMRDAQAVTLNLTSTPLNGKQAQVMAELSGMLWKTGGKWFRLDSLTGQDAALWEEFQREGGITGYRAMFANGDDRARELQKELARMSRGIMAKSGGAVMDWLSDYNEALENVTRMAVYKVGRAEGLSAQQAASIAKNVSTNFNRKGQIGAQVGALYAFFNAAVQGTTRIAQTVTGPAGQKIVAGGLVLGVIQAVILAAAGFESDEPPEFIKAKSLVIPIGWATGQKDYLTVPMPLGYNVLPTISRLATEFMLGGGKKPSKYVVNMAGAIADAFNPIGNAGFSIQTVLPTVVDPLAALESNRDYTGKKIYNEDMSPMSPTPGHTRARGGASIPAKLAAEGINWLGGGNDYVPGVWSPTPEHLEYLTGQLTGGVGREVLKGFQTGQALFTGEELAAHRIPLAGRFYGTTTDGATVRDHFRSNLLELNLIEQEYTGRMEDKNGGKEFRDANPILTLADEAQAVQREVAGLNKEKRRLMESGASREKVRLQDDKMRGRMEKFNQKIAEKRDALDQ